LTFKGKRPVEKPRTRWISQEVTCRKVEIAVRRSKENNVTDKNGNLLSVDLCEIGMGLEGWQVLVQLPWVAESKRQQNEYFT
jgi:hypothetical protein